MIGALSWMHKATGNSTYLSLATPFLNTALSTFAGPNVNGIVTELCEPAGNCNRDQQGFKAILVRNLAYLYRESSDDQVRSSIMNTLDTTVKGMIAKSCDDDWNCNGNWSEGAAPLKYVRSQHASAALLVAAMGVHADSTGTGLLTDVNSTSPSTGTGSSGGSANTGWYTSQPYYGGAPPALGFQWPVVAWSLALASVGAVLVAR